MTSTKPIATPDDIERVQRGITRLLVEGGHGVVGEIVWHLGSEPRAVTLEPRLRGAPAQCCQAMAVLLGAAQ